jgi:hypothetical protein
MSQGEANIACHVIDTHLKARIQSRMITHDVAGNVSQAYRPTGHPTHCEPTFLESNGIV